MTLIMTAAAEQLSCKTLVDKAQRACLQSESSPNPDCFLALIYALPPSGRQDIVFEINIIQTF
jgi:hypothetical protein